MPKIKRKVEQDKPVEVPAQCTINNCTFQVSLLRQ
jgi:hypothetical protein